MATNVAPKPEAGVSPLSDPNDTLRLVVLDAAGDPIRETLHECRPAPTTGSPEFAECMRAFAAKVADWLESQRRKAALLGEGFAEGSTSPDPF